MPPAVSLLGSPRRSPPPEKVTWGGVRVVGLGERELGRSEQRVAQQQVVLVAIAVLDAVSFPLQCMLNSQFFSASAALATLKPQAGLIVPQTVPSAQPNVAVSPHCPSWHFSPRSSCSFSLPSPSGCNQPLFLSPAGSWGVYGSGRTCGHDPRDHPEGKRSSTCAATAFGGGFSPATLRGSPRQSVTTLLLFCSFKTRLRC